MILIVRLIIRRRIVEIDDARALSVTASARRHLFVLRRVDRITIAGVTLRILRAIGIGRDKRRFVSRLHQRPVIVACRRNVIAAAAAAVTLREHGSAIIDCAPCLRCEIPPLAMSVLHPAACAVMPMPHSEPLLAAMAPLIAGHLAAIAPHVRTVRKKAAAMALPINNAWRMLAVMPVNTTKSGKASFGEMATAIPAGLRAHRHRAGKMRAISVLRLVSRSGVVKPALRLILRHGMHHGWPGIEALLRVIHWLPAKSWLPVKSRRRRPEHCRHGMESRLRMKHRLMRHAPAAMPARVKIAARPRHRCASEHDEYCYEGKA